MVRATRRNISSGFSAGLPSLSFFKYRFSKTQRAFSLKGRTTVTAALVGLVLAAAGMEFSLVLVFLFVLACSIDGASIFLGSGTAIGAVTSTGFKMLV